MLNTRKHRLVALRIPAGWEVSWNSFYDVEPATMPEDETKPLQDLLQLTSPRRGLLIDLGWSGSPPQHHLVMLKGSRSSEKPSWSWDQPLKRFQTRSTAEAAAKIDQWLEEPE
jgi:hypothetical protein